MPRPPLLGTVPSATIWNRLEPLPATNAVDTALQARLADPLWLLARQWQFGELSGEDAGSPIDVLVDTEAAPLSRLRLGGPAAPALAYVPGEAPLEAIVEAEPVRQRDAGLAADCGLHFLRMLSAADLDPSIASAVVAAYPLTLPLPADPAADQAGTHAHWLLAGAVPDARTLAADLRTPGSDVPAALGVPEADRAAVQAVADAWLGWYDALVVEPPAPAAQPPQDAPPAWDSRRLEHRFAVSAVRQAGGVTLEAERYRDGDLDWPDFEVAAANGLGDVFGLPTPVRRTHRLLPTPVSFPGMPARRFWEIEDTSVSFAGLDAGLTDVGQVLLAEFGLIYGNDWFAVPVDAPVGTLLAVGTVTVTDSFGVRTTMARLSRSEGAGRPWAVAEFAAPDTLPARVREVVAVVPSPAGVLRGRAIERVEFGRDEMANLAWAVEHLVTGPAGTPVDRSSEVAMTGAVPLPPDAGGAALIFRVASPAPPHWVAYAPTPVPGEPAGVTRLDRQATPGSRARVTAESSVLEEAEVPPGGVVVERSWQLARWLGGRTRLWVGRRVVSGTGPVASGLAWDRTEPAP
jgi:hypothetical protein